MPISRGHRKMSAKGAAFRVAIVAVLLFCAAALSACAISSLESDNARSGSSNSPAVIYLSSDYVASSSSSDGSDAASSSSARSASENAPVTYPTGWLVAPQGEIPAGSAVRVLRLPDMVVEPHRSGTSLPEGELQKLSSDSSAPAEGRALVEYGGSNFEVDPDALLVNLPDVVPGAVCDIVYSYSSTSQCVGQDIPGVTGRQLPGYVDGAQYNAYWDEPRYVVPCAYRTALKVRQVEEALETQGLRLLVFDAYRPISAQNYLSDAFQSAFASNSAMQESLGSWSLNWYVATGASGHNYGTDIDAGVCDMAGNPLPMPSAFDAFDESGHLTAYPVDSGSIGEEIYRDAVLQNEACMALHRAFVAAGFSELASEWWHFGDEGTEEIVRALAGPGGLDFVAQLS